MPVINVRYCCSYSSELIEELTLNGIEYTGGVYEPFFNRRSSVVFSVPLFELKGEKFLKIIDETKITEFRRNVYSEEEMQFAQWYSMACNNMKISTDKETEAFAFFCRSDSSHARHKQQVSQFVMKSPPKLNRNHNVVADFRGTTFFVNLETKKALEQSCLNGMAFWNVLRSSDRKPFETVYQMLPVHMLPTSVLLLKDSPNCHESICPMCGRKQYVVDGTFVLKVRGTSLTGPCDIYRTDYLFGSGFAYPKIIVSRKFKNYIDAKKLGRNLQFEPVTIV